MRVENGLVQHAAKRLFAFLKYVLPVNALNFENFVGIFGEICFEDCFYFREGFLLEIPDDIDRPVFFVVTNPMDQTNA